MANPTIDARRSAAMILAGMMTLGLSDNFVPFITEAGSLWQFHLIRGGLAVALFAVLGLLGFARFWPRRFWRVLARNVFTAGAMLLYFGCLAFLPIGVVVAGLFTAPLFVLMISAIVQRRRVGPVRWAAVVVGFLGALMVIRPDPDNLDVVAFLPIVAGLLYAIGAVATRAWCEGEGTVAMSAVFFALLAIFGTVGCLVLPQGGALGAEGFVVRGWMPLTGNMVFWYAVQAVGALIGIAFIFGGYQSGEASYVAIFEYSLLIFASFWAWILWQQEVPPMAMLGMALIFAAGAVIALRSEAG